MNTSNFLHKLEIPYRISLAMIEFHSVASTEQECKTKTNSSVFSTISSYSVLSNIASSRVLMLYTPKILKCLLRAHKIN
jgi:hypothetical protein